MAVSPGDHFTVSRVGGQDSACSTPFASAPSGPARDLSFRAFYATGFYSAPVSPARGAGDEYDYCDFDFSSPVAVPMSSADELFHNGRIRPVRLSSFLHRPQALHPLVREVPVPQRPGPAEAAQVVADEWGRLRKRSVHRRSSSHSPFRPDCPSPPSSRSSSSSSKASSASSPSSSSHHSRWRFLKDLLYRSNTDGGIHHPHPRCPPQPDSKRSTSPASTEGRRATRSWTHARLYETRRAEAEETRRRTFLPYRQGLLLGCLGLSSQRYSAMHSLASVAKSGRDLHP